MVSCKFIDGVAYEIKFVPEKPQKRVVTVDILPLADKKNDNDNPDNDDEDTLFDSDEDPINKIQEGGGGGSYTTTQKRGA
jgi:hypothetical protein